MVQVVRGGTVVTGTAGWEEGSRADQVANFIIRQVPKSDRFHAKLSVST